MCNIRPDPNPQENLEHVMAQSYRGTWPVAPTPFTDNGELDTEGMRRLLNPALKDKLTESIPVKRLGRVHDIAGSAVFLASPAASFVTGAVLVVDGGDSLRPPYRFWGG